MNTVSVSIRKYQFLGNTMSLPPRADAIVIYIYIYYCVYNVCMHTCTDTMAFVAFVESLLLLREFWGSNSS